MKRVLLLFVVVFAMSLATEANAQARKFVMFEHFTSGTCAPCAAQNPIFEALYQQNLGKAHHIAYHTDWPSGGEEMNHYNPTPVREMVTYYGVTGVPAMRTDGNDLGGPSSITQGMIDDPVNMTSPIALSVAETRTDDSVTAVVSYDVVGSLPSGSYILKLAAVERIIDYDVQPGNNGETSFPNVFRQFYANGSTGMALNITDGDSGDISFTYAIDKDTWNLDEMYSLAWIQNTATKEVINSAASYDVDFTAVSTATSVFQAGDINGNAFTGTVSNNEGVDMMVNVELVAEDPTDWDASYTFLGNTYSDNQTFTVSDGDHDIALNVTAGNESGIGKYQLIITPVNSVISNKLNYLVISGVKDLVVEKTYDGVDFITPYQSGLTYANNDAYADMTDDYLNIGINDGALDGVNNIYYNIGWNFPAFTDETVASLQAFMDRGGNLLIAGQDIGWDVMSGHTAAHGTPAQMAFFTNYLHAEYIDDGTAARSQFSGTPNESIFGNVATSNILRPYGSTAIYPDELNPVGGAHSIIQYNDGANGGVRALGNGYKVVYLGIGLEHVANSAVSDEIVKLSHDWFYGLISTTEFDQAMAELQMGQSFPNPASDFAIIPFEGASDKDLSIRVSDINGKVLMIQEIKDTDQTVRLNTTQLAEGVYFYQVTDGSQVGAPKKIIVAR